MSEVQKRHDASPVVAKIFSYFKKIRSYLEGQPVNTFERVEIADRVTVECRWSKDSTQKWAGYTKSDVLSLVRNTVEFLKIHPNQNQELIIYLGDHIAIHREDGEILQNIAFCLNYEDESTQICQVILNRSRELALHVTQKSQTDHVEHSLHPASKIRCTFAEPWECLVWVVTEELHHAKCDFISQKETQADQWQEKYELYRQKKNFVSSRDYDLNILEVAASRVCLRALIIEASKRNKLERVEYYKLLYKQSLQTGNSVAPNMVNVQDTAFTNTGYKPDQVG